MIPTGCEYNMKSRFSNISITSWNWHFTKSMSSGEGEREDVDGGSAVCLLCVEEGHNPQSRNIDKHVHGAALVVLTKIH